MIDIMVVAKKDIKNRLLNSWTDLRKLNTHPTFGRPATMLSDSHPLVATDKVLIVETGLESISDKMNAIKFQNDLQTVIKTVFGTKMFIYTVSRVESVRLQQKYINLRQVSKLPKADSITLEFLGD
jgi:DNA polymerase-3 subunit gamma/tau